MEGGNVLDIFSSDAATSDDANADLDCDLFDVAFDSVMEDDRNRVHILHESLAKWYSALLVNRANQDEHGGDTTSLLNLLDEDIDIASESLALARDIAAAHYPSTVWPPEISTAFFDTLPVLVELAMSDTSCIDARRSCDTVLQQLSSDKTANDTVIAHSKDEAAADIRLLMLAAEKEVHLSKCLLEKKLAKERSRLLETMRREAEMAATQVRHCIDAWLTTRGLLVAHGLPWSRSSPASAAKLHECLLAAPIRSGDSQVDTDIACRMRQLALNVLKVEAGPRPISHMCTPYDDFPPSLAMSTSASLHKNRVGPIAKLPNTSGSAAHESAIGSTRTANILRDGTAAAAALALALVHRDGFIPTSRSLTVFRSSTGWPKVAEACSCTYIATVPANLSGVNLAGMLSRSESDWSRLDDGRHLNDAILDFFLNLLTQAFSRSVYVFSSLFIPQLTSRDAQDGWDGWENVKTWTRSARRSALAGVFASDVLFVPVHQKNHWSLAVVYRPWAAAKTAQDTLPQDERNACIVFLDSLGYSKKVVKNTINTLKLLRGYLAREWAECYGSQTEQCDGSHSKQCSYDPLRLKGRLIRDVPTQQNDLDCGIFVLEFALQLLRKPSLLHDIVRGKRVLTSQEWNVPSMPRQRWRRAAEILRVTGIDGNWLQVLFGLDDDS